MILTGVDLKYAYALLPIVISHLAIPPLSLLNGEQSLEQFPPWFVSIVELFYSNLTPPQLLSRRFVESLCCDMNSAKNQSISEMVESGDLTRLSYMLVHADFQHMISNLRAIATFGVPVYRQLGMEGMHVLYLLGGVAAIWPSLLHDKTVRQRAAVLEDTLIEYVPGAVRALLPDYVQQHVYSAGAYLTGKVLDALPRVACGSSGAACALLGASMVFEARDLLLLWREMTMTVGRVHQNKRRVAGETLVTPARLWRLGQHALYLMTAVSYMTQEVQMIAMSRTALFSLSKQYGFLSMFSIGHSAHVQGCLFGLLAGYLSLT